MLKLLKYLSKRNLLQLFFIAVFVVCQVWLELTMPDYTQQLTKIISTAQANGTDINMADVWFNGGMMILCALGSMVSAFICGFLSARVAAALSRNVRKALFFKVNDFSQKEINDFSTPSLITRTTNDVVQLQNFFSMGFQLMLKAPIMALWAILKISTTNMSWTLAAIIAVAIMLLFSIIVIIFGISRFRKIQTLTDELNDRTRENVSGVRVIRAFNAEQYQTKKFESVNSNVYKNNMEVNILTGMLNPILTLVMNGLTLSIFWIGAYLINDSTSTLERANLMGEMTAFSSYAMQIVMSFMMLVFLFIILPRTVVSAKRINEVLDKEITIKDGKNETLVKGGNIEFKNVSFSYNGDDKYSLKNLSFEIEKGKTTAIIGPTGSGKTTIVNLLARLYDTSSGDILVDGINVRDYKIDDLENKISIASQKAMLIKGDIRSNITYGSKGDIDLDKLNLAINVSQSEFILNDEKGLDKEVSQGGSNFSGGQKQRLSIARALYKDSDILVFDDTFSALDYKTDMLVRKGINENYKDKTVIIIAQRIGTIKNADKIIVLNEGMVDSIGTHESLLETSSLYKEIALSQLEKEEL